MGNQKKKSRDDFSDSVVQALAKRAHYICSNPNCRINTLAPSDKDSMGVVFNGIAAHIKAASVGGPRYDSNQLPAQRSGIDNGIFLCNNCATAIDKNGGTDFTVELLMSWKKDHEDWIKVNFNKNLVKNIPEFSGEISVHGDGEVTGLHVSGSAIIKPGTKITASGKGIITGTKIGK